MKNLFLTFNHDVAVEENQESFDWQDPILHIEKGFNHILTGSQESIEMNVGDKVYIYGALKYDKNGQAIEGTNGIYGVGKIVDILTGKNNKIHAVVKLAKQGSENTPLVKTDVDRDFFKKLYSPARLRVGYLELSDDDTDKLDDLIKKHGN